MLKRLLNNHVLANLAFFLVLILGSASYMLLPRQQDPTINFNWIIVTTIYPGAAAEDVERKVTDPIEEALQSISDVKYISSTSREAVSTILVRFEDINSRLYDKRLADLRREVQNTENALPDAVEDPFILEITSANAFPTASVAVVGQADDNTLRAHARNIEKDLEALNGVDKVNPLGLKKPELQIDFDPVLLEKYGLNPSDVSNTVQLFFRDTAAGEVKVGEQNWLVRLVGSSVDPLEIAKYPLLKAQGQQTLGDIADISVGRKKATVITRYKGQPTVLMAITKKANANTLSILDKVREYIEQRNKLTENTGIRLVLIDDQTEMTKGAISLMQQNALIGLLFVLLITWLFLGSGIAVLTSIAIPFILAGTFWFLRSYGETLNVTVLLGVVIVLGMLVDDAVVVVEAIYYRLRHGMEPMQASLEALNEVAMPVTTAVLTTIAAFLPLMLLPGILGQFMRVIPMVVTVALLISLIEAFWMLPAHVIAFNINFNNPSKMHRFRLKLTHRMQVLYIKVLVQVLRHSFISLILVFTMMGLAIYAVVADKLKMDFFASDPIRLYYINIEMPQGTPLLNTINKVVEVENKAREFIKAGEVRELLSYGGVMFTETEERKGETYGQVFVALNPKQEGLRSVDEMIASMKSALKAIPDIQQLTFLRLAGGPPTSKPIQIKVRGDNYTELKATAEKVKEMIATIPAIHNIEDDASRGKKAIVLRLNYPAIQKSGLSPLEVTKTLTLLADGLVVAELRDQGEKVEVRVRSKIRQQAVINDILNTRIQTPLGQQIALSQLVSYHTEQALGNIRHYKYRRTITVQADLHKDQMNTLEANKLIKEKWQQYRADYPNNDLDFTGVMDSINESLNSMLILFAFGIGLMYLILGTQLRSYAQPFIILMSVPMAFTGVVFGILISGKVLSLFSLYGVVALAGIAVNASIVLISAANERIEKGMSSLHAILYAGRRRIIPIFITSLTTIAGLFSLAVGFGGESLLWGPVATAIVWGLVFSTFLTLLVIPLFYFWYQWFLSLIGQNKKTKYI